MDAFLIEELQRLPVTRISADDSVFRASRRLGQDTESVFTPLRSSTQCKAVPMRTDVTGTEELEVSEYRP